MKDLKVVLQRLQVILQSRICSTLKSTHTVLHASRVAQNWERGRRSSRFKRTNKSHAIFGSVTVESWRHKRMK